jgi:methanogenic corrinoid protein MtbC1
VSVIAIGVTNVAVIEDARLLVASLKDSSAAPVVVGGAAINASTAAHIGADGWASDGRTAVEAIAAITAR